MSKELYIVITPEIEKNPEIAWNKIKDLPKVTGSYEDLKDRIASGKRIYPNELTCIWFEGHISYAGLYYATNSPEASEYEEYKILRKNLIGGKLI